MTTNIQLLRSSVPYKRPSAAPLLEGQVAINYNAAEPGLFYRLTDGRLAKVGPVAITDNGVKPNEAPGGETGNSLGETWLNAQPTLYNPILYVFDGNDWVTANGFKVDITTGDFTLDRVLTVNQLITNELYVYGNAVIGGNITPNGQNCAYYLGLPNERWDYGYLCNLDVSKNGLISIDLTVGQDASITRDIEIGRHVASNLIPDTDVTRSFGTASQRWKETHTNSLNAYGNTKIGELCSDTLTVDATSTFNCGVDFTAPIQIDQIGESCSDSLTIFATTLVKCPTTFESTIKVPQIGTACTETLTVQATSTFKCPATFEQPIEIAQIGNSCSSTLTVNATSLFKCLTTFESGISTPQIGTGCSDNLSLNAVSTFKCDVFFEKPMKGPIVIGDGCNTSTINLNGAITQSCDMLPSAHNTRNLGSSSVRYANVFSQLARVNTLTVDGKATSASTVDADAGTTLTTKDFVLNKLLNQSGNISIGDGCSTSSINLNGAVTLSCDMLPAANNTRDIGTSTNRLKTLFSQGVTTYALTVDNKAISSSTVDSDPGVTLTTKDYVITKINQPTGTIILGDGCVTSTINLNGAVTLSCDMTPSANNTRSIGTSSAKLKEVYSTTVYATTSSASNVTGHKLTGDVTVDNNVRSIGTSGAKLKEVHSTTVSASNVAGHKLTGDITVDDNLRSIGTSGAKLKAVYATDVYTGDLHLKNEKGDWTMIEAEDYLTIRNNKTGKTFRLLMEEV